MRGVGSAPKARLPLWVGEWLGIALDASGTSGVEDPPLASRPLYRQRPPAQADPWTGRLLISCLKQEPSILASRLVWNRSTVARDQLLSAENTAAANYLFPDFRVSSHVCRGMCKCNQWWLVEL